MLCILLNAADDAIGRFNNLCIPQQSLIEMLFLGIEDIGIAKDKDGDFIPIEDWSIIKFDSNGDVIAIECSGEEILDLYDSFDDSEIEERSIRKSQFNIGGSVALEYLPASVRSVSLENMEISGSIETENLPGGLRAMNLYQNCLSGNFEVSGLPQKIEYIDISYNLLTGTLDSGAMPGSLRTFHAKNNNFHGSVILTALPGKLCELGLSGNDLSGEIILRNIPDALKTVELSFNNFEEDRIVAEPHEFRFFEVDKAFEGKVVNPEGECINLKGLSFPFSFHSLEYEEVKGSYLGFN